LRQRLTVLAGDGDAGEIALDVGAEDRHPGPRKSFRHDLQADRLAGAGGTRDQAVAIGITEGEVLRPGAGAEVDLVVDEHVASGRLVTAESYSHAGSAPPTQTPPAT